MAFKCWSLKVSFSICIQEYGSLSLKLEYVAQLTFIRKPSI